MAKNNCVCILCGIEFHRKPSHIKKGEGKYCSYKCKYAGTTKEVQLDDQKEIVRLYKEGLSLSKLSEKFKIHSRKIKKILRENKIEIRTPKEQRKVMFEKGLGNWTRKTIKNCKICGNQFVFHAGSKETYCSIKCRSACEDNTRKIREATLRQIAEGRMPNAYTSIEKKVKDFLDEKGINYEYQKPFGYWVYDFLIGKVFLECDGDYWHGNPRFFTKLNDMQRKNRRNDKRKDGFAIRNGYRILRFWEDEINNNFEDVKGEILRNC